jgi:hypothetical protein
MGGNIYLILLLACNITLNSNHVQTSCYEVWCALPLHIWTSDSSRSTILLGTVSIGLDPLPLPCSLKNHSLPYTLWPWRWRQCVPSKHTTYKTTWCHSLEDHNVNNHCHENLKSITLDMHWFSPAVMTESCNKGNIPAFQPLDDSLFQLTDYTVLNTGLAFQWIWNHVLSLVMPLSVLTSHHHPSHWKYTVVEVFMFEAWYMILAMVSTETVRLSGDMLLLSLKCHTF